MTKLLWLCLGHYLVLLWISSAILLTISSAMPPPNPIKCNNINLDCQLFNSYGVWGDRQTCRALNIVYPTTEEQLRQELANANKNNLKVKIVTKFSHTIPKLACPSNSKNSVFISTEKYDSTVDINMEKLTVTADGGVGLRKLIDTIEKAGLSLVAATYWEGVTVAGVISTGAHGSSWWGKGGAIHDHVIGLNLIIPANEYEGYAKIIKLTPQDQLFNAAKVSLGLLGIISKVRNDFLKKKFFLYTPNIPIFVSLFYSIKLIYKGGPL